jgi:ubiquinone biosynthesis protein UbiJ
MNLPSPLIFAFELAFNKALELDEDARNRFIKLSGKVIGLYIKGFDIQLFLMPALDGVNISADYDGQVDAWIRGAPFSLLHTAMTHERDRFLSGDVEIDGDTELGQKVQNILRHFQFDWEEVLSKGVGDIAAHQIGNTLRSFFDWGNYAVDALARDSAEYMQEERRDIVGRYELEEYNKQVDDIRLDVDRLEQRIARLARRDEQA